MFAKLQKRFALSPQGLKDFLKGVVWTTVLDIALMATAVYTFAFLAECLPALLSGTPLRVPSLKAYAAGALIAGAAVFVIARIQYDSTYTLVYGESANRRISLAEKLRILPLAFFGEKNLSDLTATIMDDCTDLEHTFSHAVPQLFASVASVALIALGLFFYDWRLSLALFWVVPAAAAVLLGSKGYQHRSQRNMYGIKRAVSEHIQEGIDTIQEIKSCSMEEAFFGKFGDTITAYEKSLIRGELMVGSIVNSAQSILKLGLGSVILLGAALLAQGTLEVFPYLVFLVVATRIYNPVSEVFNNLAALFYLDIRIDRMNEMEALPVQTGAAEFTPKGYDIEFKDVRFSYESGKTVLDGVSFTAAQGEITALVGPSGSGKTTAAKLAARFWDIQKGQILLGGVDISGIESEVLLRHFSIVFQDVTLFNTSIKENIRIGRRSATDEEILAAARLAQCDEFVSRMKNGYDTVIGENGETLSGGERQRISIARALLKNAPVILLDEATASLDAENETLIQEALTELIRDKTVLVIAHRMRTVATADRVVVLDRGRVAETGAPEKLLGNPDGLFSRMAERQKEEAPGLKE